jgi:hypothetical protein
LTATAAEIDLAEDGHAIIMRCRIVLICKTGWKRFDAPGERREAFKNASRSPSTFAGRNEG